MPPSLSSCLNCGVGLPAKTPGQGGMRKFCSLKCRDRATYLRYHGRQDRSCGKCGAPIPANRHANRDYCSRQCKVAVDAAIVKANHLRRYREDSKYAETFRRNGHIRRARLCGAGIDRFSPIEILERDGWKCQICGCDTPKEMRGQKVANAPTLDHIIPLAKGGEHSRLNTQCACHRCNARKGAKIGVAA